MNDGELRSPDDVEFEEVDMGKQPQRMLKIGSTDDDDEFSNVALSEARNKNYNYDEDEGGH